MKMIATTEANRQFSKVIQEVREGETFVVTSHGEPVAKITAFKREESDRQRALDAYFTSRKAVKPMNLGRFNRDDAYDN